MNNELALLKLLLDNQAFSPSSAVAFEILEASIPLPRRRVRQLIEKMKLQQYMNAKSRQIGSRIFNSFYLTPKGLEFTQQQQNIQVSPYMINHHNLELSLTYREDRLLVQVLSSPSGETSAEGWMSTFRIDDLISHTVNQEHGSLWEISKEIADSLFPDSVRHCYEASMGIISHNPYTGLRIMLRMEDENVASIPWELARIGEDYLSLRPKTPISRYVQAPIPPALPKIDGPIRILGINSNPSDQDQLDIITEKAVLQNALAPLMNSKIELTWLDNCTIQDLVDALRQGHDFIHFTGHGYYSEKHQEGGLIFTNLSGSSQNISTEWLTILLRDSSIRFIFLNCCESGRSISSVAHSLVQRGITAALGMQAPVEDTLAIAFADGFYRALSDKWPIDASVVEGRKSIIAALGGNMNRAEWALPVLYMRSPSGQLFQ